MAEEEVIATGSESGAGENTQTQGAESTSQEAGQSQSSEGTQQVGSTPTDASSKAQPGRSNVDWALQRKIEKAIEKTLGTALPGYLKPLLDKLEGSQVPPAAQTAQTEEALDFNDLPGSLRKLVKGILDERLKNDLPKTLNSFKSEITGEITGRARLQEARNYLNSQKDIGTDELKLAEIRKVIEENPIDFSDPVKGTQFAVALWRTQKTNPNAPPRSHLTGLPGGAGTQPKREASIADLKALQEKLSGNLTIEEQEKLGKEIDALVFSK